LKKASTSTSFPAPEQGCPKNDELRFEAQAAVVIWRVRRFFVLLFLILLSLPAASGKNNDILHWSEGEPGCTFSADEDGLYRYGLWTNDFGIVMAVDADELRKASSRTEPAFAVLVTVRYRGKDSLMVDPDEMSLEFVKHDHDRHAAFVPDDLADKLQKDADELSGQIEREMREHPGTEAQEQSMLDDREKSVLAAIQFVKTRSLTATRLDPDHSQVSGWVFFSARSKWIGDWKKQEELILRIPLANRVVEFPFALPPSRGDLLLRRRPKE
jgi:hypothetical protein